MTRPRNGQGRPLDGLYQLTPQHRWSEIYEPLAVPSWGLQGHIGFTGVSR